MALKAKPKTFIGSQRSRCVYCGEEYGVQKRNFPTTHSFIYKANNGYLPICYKCLEDVFQTYVLKLGNEKDAMQRTCSKFDIYWHPDIFNMLANVKPGSSKVSIYISRSNLARYVTKTYDDSINEAANVQRMNDMADYQASKDGSRKNTAPVEPDIEDEDPPDQADVEFWGRGFDNGFYEQLNQRYAKWTQGGTLEMDNALEALYKQVCILEVTITRNAAAGKPIESTVNSLNTLLGSLNLKPVQQKAEDQSDTAFGEMPLGVGIKVYEDRHPIPEPDPELRDVDGIIRYISIWFLGHLAKLVGLKNVYSRMYEEEMARLRVERLVNEDEDDEEAFYDIFGDGSSSDGDP